MTKLFGSSGIRGVYGEKITPELMISVGKAIGGYLKKGKVIIARDTRKTSELLEKAFIAGVESTGIEISRAGLAPTPALAFATRGKCFDTGGIITASHNPDEYNGIKLWNSDSSAYTPEMEREIEKLINGAQEHNGTKTQWDKITNSEEIDIISDYSSTILNAVKLTKKINVVFDCGKSVAKQTISIISKQDQIESTIIEPDREREPIGENLEELKRTIKENSADVGFAFDGDADRLGVLDENGDFIQKDKLLALLAVHELKKEKGTVVFPVDTSLLVEETVKTLGGEVHLTKIGDVFVAEKMKETKAVFGGEPSGCFIFPKVHWCPDGILACLKVLEILEQENKKLSELVAELPEYYTIRKKIKCTEQEKEKKCMEIYEKIKSLSGTEKIIEIDGVRVDFEDSWVLARPSGTEPIVRLTVEAKNKERADELLMKIIN